MDDRPLKGHYKILPSQDSHGLVSLKDAVAQELARMGDLVFVLVGTVMGLRPYSQPVKSRTVKELRLDPGLDTNFAKVADSSYAVKTVLPIEDLLVQISASLSEGRELSATDRQAISEAYNALLDAATTDVAVPTGPIVQPRNCSRTNCGFAPSPEG